MLSWLPDSGASSARLYWEAAQEQAAQPPPSGPDPTPAGFSIFPGEAVRASRRWVESRCSQVLHDRQLERGGHVPALEQPAASTQEIRDSLRAIR